MPSPLPSLLLVAADDDLAAASVVAGWAPARAADLDDKAAAARHDAVLVQAATPEALAALVRWPGLARACLDAAVVVQAEPADAALEADLLRLGVEAFVPPGDAALSLRAVRHAVERKCVERAARTAYATDLATGLPHQAQLVEHMAQLLALREREPAPMVLIVLRIDAHAGMAPRPGSEAAQVLRRKVAVRLRGALRASDVVAAIGPDAFGVLLGRLESPNDGERVAAKLVRSLQRPFTVAGQSCAVAAAVGLALYPEHGRDAQTLLHRAGAQAGSIAWPGRDGHAAGSGRGPDAAANDDAS